MSGPELIPSLIAGLPLEERELLLQQIVGKGSPEPLGESKEDRANDVPAGAAEIICVVDRSGSMGAIRNDAIGGFNQFVEEQRRLPGAVRLTLALFDHEYDLVYDAVPLAEAPPLDESTYVPRGTTALYDALGRTLEAVGQRLVTGEPKESQRVVVCVLTDGMENASTDYTATSVRRLIEAKREAGWAFVFLAADEDAIEAARSFSIPAADTAMFEATGTGVRRAYARVSARVADVRQGR